MAELDLKIEKDFDNKLLDRRELEVLLTYAGAAPSRKEVKDAIVHKLAIDPESIVIVKIDNSFGLRVSKAVVYAYHSKELAKSAPKHLLERENKQAKEAKQAPKQEAQAQAK